jgi:hypothetical protein
MFFVVMLIFLMFFYVKGFREIVCYQCKENGDRDRQKIL